MSYYGINDTFSDLSAEYRWPDGEGMLPENMPRCGFKGNAPICAGGCKRLFRHNFYVLGLPLLVVPLDNGLGIWAKEIQKAIDEIPDHPYFSFKDLIRVRAFIFMLLIVNTQNPFFSIDP